jgi:hypothetical protein
MLNVWRMRGEPDTSELVEKRDQPQEKPPVAAG